MNYYVYIVKRDFGFAPNPFGMHCTLATCKPRIRKRAEVNDWIFGISPKKKLEGNDLIFAMKVAKKITFNEYWVSKEYEYKKPVLNGSLKLMYGDNIYYHDDNDVWFQANSHHSFADGSINYYNLNRDKKGEYVLISDIFYYFGKSLIAIPFGLKNEFSVGIGHKKIDEDTAQKVINWLENNYENGYQDDPILFDNFKRYDGL